MARRQGSPIFDSFNADREYILKEIDAYDREIAIADRELARSCRS